MQYSTVPGYAVTHGVRRVAAIAQLGAMWARSAVGTAESRPGVSCAAAALADPHPSQTHHHHAITSLLPFLHARYDTTNPFVFWQTSPEEYRIASRTDGRGRGRYNYNTWRWSSKKTTEKYVFSPQATTVHREGATNSPTLTPIQDPVTLTILYNSTFKRGSNENNDLDSYPRYDDLNNIINQPLSEGATNWTTLTSSREIDDLNYIIIQPLSVFLYS